MTVGPFRVSVVLPIYNEREVLPELHRRLTAVLDGLPGGPHEVILVDDGSSDGTGEALDRLVEEDGRFAAVHFSRNFGHQTALTAGLDHASGDYVVMMDADLQDPPEAIPQLLEKAQQGYDVVYAQRMKRKEGPLLRAGYFLAYRLIAAFADIRVPLDSGDFGLVSRRVADELRTMPERQRFLRGLRAWVGYRQIGLPIERHARQAGDAKYTMRRLIGLAIDGLFAFSVVPLRLAALLGSCGIALASLYGLWALYARFFLDQSPRGFTTLIVAIIFFSGVQLLFLGVIGEYVGRIYEEVKRRPHYVLDRVARGRSSTGLPDGGSEVASASGVAATADF